MTWLKREKPKTDLCDGCAAELQQATTSTNETTMRFLGPVLVRSMPSSQVLSLPGACRLYIGNSLEMESLRFQSEWRKRDRHESWWLTGKWEAEEDRALQAAVAAKQDPTPAVREIATQLETALRAGLDQRRANEATQKQSSPRILLTWNRYSRPKAALWSAQGCNTDPFDC